MNVGDICTREIAIAVRESSLQEAAALMRERHVGSLLVVGDSPNGPQAVGIVTDRDMVIEGVARGMDVTQTDIGRFAEGNLAAIAASATIGEAIATMRERGVRRLLVSTDGGTLFGIVSLDDLLGALAHDLQDLAYTVRSGIDRETDERPPFADTQFGEIRIPPYPVA
ncbi:MAG: CBS domain-containing protein [Betaproteobacteria bacterium]|nr:CBS domain-containing protein [Betaproteobacteria bacterium]